jgi:hypothetical protein
MPLFLVGIKLRTSSPVTDSSSSAEIWACDLKAALRPYMAYV